jgi:hypothetical protein
MENSAPIIAAPMLGSSFRTEVPPQNPGPKLAVMARWLRPSVRPSSTSAAREASLMPVNVVWMTAAVRTPRILIHVSATTETMASRRCGESPI